MGIIGTNIKNMRTKKNLTLKEVAKKCGITESTLAEIESGRKIPSTHVINTISKVLGVSVDAIEPSYFSEAYLENIQPQKEQIMQENKYRNSKSDADYSHSENTLSNAFTKAIRKIPVLTKITAGKPVPFEGDIADYKYEPVFQGKGNNVAGEEFIYYVCSDNSMSNSRILKGDLLLVFLTDSIMDKNILLLTHKGKTHVRRLKILEDGRYLLYPDNPEFEVIIADKRDISIIGKILRIEFKV